MWYFLAGAEVNLPNIWFSKDGISPSLRDQPLSNHDLITIRIRYYISDMLMQQAAKNVLSGFALVSEKLILPNGDARG